MKKVLISFVLISLIITGCGKDVEDISKNVEGLNLEQAIIKMNNEGLTKLATDNPVQVSKQEAIIKNEASLDTKHAMQKDIVDILKVISKTNNLPDKVTIVEMGAMKNKEGLGNWMIVTIPRTKIKNLNNLYPHNLKGITIEYWLHPDFK